MKTINHVKARNDQPKSTTQCGLQTTDIYIVNSTMHVTCYECAEVFNAPRTPPTPTQWLNTNYPEPE